MARGSYGRGANDLREKLWLLGRMLGLGIALGLAYILTMAPCINRRFILLAAPLMAGLAVFPASADQALRADPSPEPVVPEGTGVPEGAAAPEVLVALQASEVDEAALKWLKRPVIVFADTPNDPNYLRQIELLGALHPALLARDVVLIIDTDPAAASPLRKRLRPRGFSLVMMDKDWLSPIRRPSPRPSREILGAIDRMPIARTEALERSPAGR